MRKTTAARNAEAQAEKQERLRELTLKLENGVKAVFESEDYARYLQAMSKFHHYSFGNCLLIHFQCPHASAVAGYTTWKKLGRTVKKGEKGIQILAPCPTKLLVEQNKMDEQGRFIFGPDGQPETPAAPVPPMPPEEETRREKMRRAIREVINIDESEIAASSKQLDLSVLNNQEVQNDQQPSVKIPLDI